MYFCITTYHAHFRLILLRLLFHSNKIIIWNTIYRHRRPFRSWRFIMGLLPDTQICGCACAGNAGNVFPVTAGKRSRHASRHVRHARAVMHVGIANQRFPLKSAAGENVPGIPGACATCNYPYLVRGPWILTLYFYFQNQHRNAIINIIIKIILSLASAMLFLILTLPSCVVNLMRFCSIHLWYFHWNYQKFTPRHEY